MSELAAFRPPAPGMGRGLFSFNVANHTRMREAIRLAVALSLGNGLVNF